MDLSVVVPTLNGRERLTACLDALAEHAPAAEVVVVNGPSADGTTGMVRERPDVDALVEIAERNVNVARNAGARVAGGDVVAILADDLRIEPGWAGGIRAAAAAGAAAVTGPVRGAGPGGAVGETRRIGGREVTYFDGGNVAFARRALSAIDGFDEYLQTGGARDAAHRLAARGLGVEWAPAVAASREGERGGGLRADLPRPNAAGEEVGRDWAWKYRSLSYRLVKNYGPRPGVAGRVLRHALADAGTGAAAVLRGEEPASRWIADGREVLASVAVGARDGLAARLRDRSPRRNPNGEASRADRAVARYDWR